MSKKLNIIEAMKMPIGTEFTITINGQKHDDTVTILDWGDDSCNKILVWNNNKNCSVTICDSTIDATFIPIQQPVSFMEAINSGKRVKVVHSRVIHERYMTITDLFEFMANGAHDFPIVLINEGKWYTDERGELEDEKLS